MNPHEHACNAYSIDYSQAFLSKVVVCKICGRTWTLTKRGWYVQPLTRGKP